MASLNFDESIVLVLFVQAGGNVGGTRDVFVQFDGDLQRTFGAKLLRIMSEEGMDPDIHNRSVVLGCRPHMAGNTPDLQIRNACRYVLHAQQVLGAPAIAAFKALDSGDAKAPSKVKRPISAAKHEEAGKRRSAATAPTAKKTEPAR